MQKDAELLADMWGEVLGKDYQISMEKTQKGLDIIRVKPSADNQDTNSFLIDSAFFINSDDTYIFVGVFISGTLKNDIEACVESADKMINSIELGQRKIGQSVQTAMISNDINIQIPEGFVLYEQNGVDFDVYYIAQITTADISGMSAGIYIGSYPSTNIENVKKGDEGYIFKQSKILGENVLWVGTMENGIYSWEAMVHPYDEFYRMHIFFTCNDNSEFEQIVDIIETMEFIDK